MAGTASCTGGSLGDPRAPLGGRGRFLHESGSTTIPVHVASGVEDPHSAQVLFVMHGTERNAAAYRDAWVPLVAGHDVLVVVPEFDEADFPGADGYNLGGMVRAGRPVPRSQWAFSRILPIFEDVVARVGGEQATYRMFGHSAGAQFVHRYLEFVPDAPVTTAVAANAGWYTMPDPDSDFPYGLGRLPVPDVDRRRLFARDLRVLVGSEDLLEENLRQDSGATRQGATRYERALEFYRRGRDEARRSDLPFRWRLEVVPGVGHDHAAMSRVAADAHLLAR